MIGQQVSHYRIVEKLGGGGMGVVFRAEDLTLGRFVALKFLSGAVAERSSVAGPGPSVDAQAVQRFMREARAASALNHPNICTVYEIGEHEGHPFLAMELLVGQTLEQRMVARPLTVEELVGFATQAADALDAAHRRGIIHRDIKPANLFVTERGEAKILDFGIAKLTPQLDSGDTFGGVPGRGEPAYRGSQESTSVSPQGVLTTEGTAMGTVAYMSPEQARGEELDARTDLFSLGAVFYEVAARRPAFAGNTAAVIFNQILNIAPAPPAQLNSAIPERLSEIITRLLEKDRELRYQGAADLRSELKRLRRDSGAQTGSIAATGTTLQAEAPGPVVVPARSAWLSRPLAAGGGLLALVAIAVLVYLLAPGAPAPRVTGATQVTRDGRAKNRMVTDGSRIYFSTAGVGNSLYQVAAAGGDTLPIETSIRGPVVTDISPDRSELLVLSCIAAVYQQNCPIWIEPILGHAPRRLRNLQGADAIWSPDGKEIVYAQGAALYRVSSDGSNPRQIVSVPGGQPSWMRYSPDGTRLRFSVYAQNSGASIWEVTATGENLHQLLPGWNNPASECCGSWTPDGRYYIFQSSRGETANLWALREGRSLRGTSREPMQLTTGPTSTSSPQPSADGKRIFAVTAQIRGELVRYDAHAGSFSPFLSGISAMTVKFSRDGQWVTYVSYPDFSLWKSRVDGTERTQLTTPPFFPMQPRWSPDGTRIAFMGQVQQGKPWGVYVVPAEGGNAEPVLPGNPRGCDPNWSPDGKSLLIGRFPADEPPDGSTLDLETIDLATHATHKIPGSEGLWSPRWSPDGQQILAYTASRDRVMLYDAKTETWSELASIGIGWPEWSHDGKDIWFLGSTSGAKQSGIFRIRVSDRKLEEMVDLKDFRQAPGWGDWLGLTPDDAPMLLRDAGTQDIYALGWEAR